MILKIFFFLSFSRLGVTGPYFSLYLKEAGLSGAQIGSLTAASRILFLLSPLLWGAVADATRRTKQLLILALAASTLLFASFALTLDFALLTLIMVGFSFFGSPVEPLTNSIALEYLERNRRDYGGSRVWGSIGFIAGSLIVGEMVDGLGLKIIFPAYVAVGALSIFAALFLPRGETEVGGKLGRDAVALLENRSFLIFLLCVVINQSAGSFYYVFFSIYMNDLGMGGRLIGISWGIAVASEVILIAFSGRILGRVGARTLFALGLAGSALRWFLYSITATPSLVLAYQALHSLTFGAFYIGAVNLISVLVPSTLRSSGQTLLTAMSFGLGGILGSILGGFLLDSIGVRGLFGVGALIALLPIGLFLSLVNARREEESKIS
ncbi:MAG: MFS transporter [bacterium]